MTKLTGLLFVLLLTLSCGSNVKKDTSGESETGEQNSASTEETTPADITTDDAAATLTEVTKITVAELMEQSGYVGSIVTVEGRCAGWNSELVAGGPPVTRSDWVLEDGDAGIYVNGSLPDGCSATEGSDRRVMIKAKVGEVATLSPGSTSTKSRCYLILIPE